MPTSCKTRRGTRCQEDSHSSPKRTSHSTTHRTAGFSRRAELHSHTSLHLDLCNHTRESLKHYHHWRVLTHSSPYISARKRPVLCATASSPSILASSRSPSYQKGSRKKDYQRASLTAVRGYVGQWQLFFSKLPIPTFCGKVLSQSATENN